MLRAIYPVVVIVQQKSIVRIDDSRIPSDESHFDRQSNMRELACECGNDRFGNLISTVLRSNLMIASGCQI